MKRDSPMKPMNILLAEDSAADALLTRRALEAARFASRLHLVEDGVKAMAFLRRQPPYADAPRPDLILLDLNMPRKDGREVLAEIKADEDLRIIPAIVLTTSSAETDVLRCYRLHANCYLTKPASFDSFATVIASLEQFWFGVVTLPIG